MYTPQIKWKISVSVALNLSESYDMYHILNYLK